MATDPRRLLVHLAAAVRLLTDACRGRLPTDARAKVDAELRKTVKMMRRPGGRHEQADRR